MAAEVQTNLQQTECSGHQQAWDMVSSQLRLEMKKATYENWVEPLSPLGFDHGVYRLGTSNPYVRDWVEDRLKTQLTRMLEGLYNQNVELRVEVKNEFYTPGLPEESIEDPQTKAKKENPPAETKEEKKKTPGKSNSKRKVALQRAYGDQRASVIQPERTLMVTNYFFSHWLPLIGHSAFAVILAARSLCYWNPFTGEMRNEIDTEIGDLAEKASVSVRTVKTVLNHDLVKKYFLRYKTRRIITANGVRTAGIVLQVRMDDPLTPEDQEEQGLEESDFWYSP